jgi:hypothetical protein
MADLHRFLEKYLDKISPQNESSHRDFDSYELFHTFILKHYDLEHMEKNNYIKFVKVMREIIKYRHFAIYDEKISNINKIFKLLSDSGITNSIDFRKYLFNPDNIYSFFEKRKKTLSNLILYLRDLYVCKCCHRFLYSINFMSRKIQILERCNKKVKYLVKDFMDFEAQFGIDYSLIKANSYKRTYLGLESESYVRKIMKNYILEKNNNSRPNIEYFYESNVNLIKLFRVSLKNKMRMKGECDGMIISFDGFIYRIENIIEVKSSVKSTFEDIYKFIHWKEYLSLYEFDKPIIYEKYTFSKKSFEKILNYEVAEWCTYICITNTAENNYIEKSYIYFYTVLKILDGDFITDFYINSDESIIEKKYEIVIKNRDYINFLYNEWKDIIRLNNPDKCNIFCSKFSLS